MIGGGLGEACTVIVALTDGNVQATEADAIDTPLLRELNQDDVAVVPVVLDTVDRTVAGGTVHPGPAQPSPVRLLMDGKGAHTPALGVGNLGRCPDTEALRFIAYATCGQMVYSSDCPEPVASATIYSGGGGPAEPLCSVGPSCRPPPCLQSAGAGRLRSSLGVTPLDPPNYYHTLLLERTVVFRRPPRSSRMDAVDLMSEQRKSERPFEFFMKDGMHLAPGHLLWFVRYASP
jgi:hypothetical protein